MSAEGVQWQYYLLERPIGTARFLSWGRRKNVASTLDNPTITFKSYESPYINMLPSKQLLAEAQIEYLDLLLQELS